jgi:DegV family protein with EDD domain
MTVAIVTDSGSDLTPALLAENKIIQVPLSVSFGEEMLLSPDQITPDEFWRRSAEPGSPFPHTAAPSVGLFKQAFERAFAEGAEGVVCVCLSDGLSATFRHAQMAKEMMPDKGVYLVDSQTASMGHGAMALRGAKMAAAGMSTPDIGSALTRMRDGISLYVGLDTLDALRKGGRISHVKAAMGGLLAVKPIITTEDGVVVLADQPRTRTKCQARVVELLSDRSLRELHILYSPPADPEWLRDAVLKELPEPAPELVTMQIIGPVIGAHVGPGAYGGIMVRDL